jgi:hypothetical protein
VESRVELLKKLGKLEISDQSDLVSLVECLTVSNPMLINIILFLVIPFFLFACKAERIFVHLVNSSL